MTTYRKVREHWTETKRVVRRDGVPEVKQVTCCCAEPAAKRRECSDAGGRSTPCRCCCHSTKLPQ